MLVALRRCWLFMSFVCLGFVASAQNPVIDINIFGPQDCSNEPIIVPVRAITFTSVKKLTFSIVWDTNLLLYQGFSQVNPGLTSGEPIITGNAVTGMLTFSMNASAGQTIDANEILFYLDFDVLGDGSDDIEINFANFPMPITVVMVPNNRASFQC